MSLLFEESFIHRLSLKNRFVRSATWEGLATEQGETTPELVDRMTSLARGGVGLIITGHAHVSPEGQATPRQLGVFGDHLIPGLKSMVSEVHENNGRIVMQLAHAGLFAQTGLTGCPALAVSQPDGETEGPVTGPVREMTPEDIEGLVSSFAQAAGRAQMAGFDGVQIHSGHGYLLSQFLSPAFNRRQDQYGGPIENRARVHLRIYQAVRKVVGPDYPILIKMNGSDLRDKGLTREDALEAAMLFSDAGFDAIEVSGGIIRTGKLSPSRPGITKESREAYFSEYAALFKKRVKTPLILVGGLRSFAVAERIVADGIADYISMSRPFIREPGLIKRWMEGDRRKAECLSDNLCFAPGFDGKGICCVTRDLEKPGSGHP